MRTWILCADHLCAKILTKSNTDSEACLYRTICRRKKNKKSNIEKDFRNFVHYIAEEIETACGAGTLGPLILCADRNVLKEFRKHFSLQVRQVILGSIEENLCHVTPKMISNRLADLCPA